MQRRIGKHDADRAVARSDRRRNPGAGAMRKNYDRTLRTEQRSSIDIANNAERFDRRDVSRHQRKRFVAASLAAPKQLDSLIVLRIAREQESPQTLHGNDLSSVQRFTRIADHRD